MYIIHDTDIFQNAQIDGNGSRLELLARAMSTNVPSFVYKQAHRPSESTEAFNLNFEVAWDHIIFLLCLVNFILILLHAHSVIRRNNLNKSTVKLEVTSGDLCILLSVMRLPLCPIFCRIEQPSDVTSLSIQGPSYARQLKLNLENFSVTDTLNNKSIKVPKFIKINYFESLKPRNISKTTFLYTFMYNIMAS